MKNLIKKIALVTIAFVAFSCSEEEDKTLRPVSIAEIAKATPEYSTFVEALEVAGLTSTFENPGDYTVFMPKNSAFTSLLGTLGYADLQALEADQPGLLADVLKYHVVSGRVLSSSLSNNQVVTTLQGDTFKVLIEQVGQETFVSLEDQNMGVSLVNAFDVQCTNGVVHPIDSVILPNLAD
jgi:uncharacterized surface protein with fasciclin (FAS1) repeats